MLIVIESVLSKDEVRRFRQQLDRAAWQDGALTAGEMAREAKTNLQIPDDAKIAIELGDHILRTLGNHPHFMSAALPRRIFPPRFNRYAGGAAYDMHVDSALMQVAATPHTLRTDISATLFLCEPDEYEGGNLEIAGTMGMRSVKAAAGDMVLYSATTLHRVTPVTRGARVASFFWVESWVKDDGERSLLYDLDRNIQTLRSTLPANNPQLLELTGIYHNLLRRWAIT